MKRTVSRVIVAVAVVVALCCLVDVAHARVGGGESFNFGSGGNNDSGGIAGDVIVLLIWLSFEHPAIGIPLLLTVLAVVLVRWLWSRRDQKHLVRRTHGPARPTRRGQDVRRGFEVLRARDAGFSEAVLLDLLQLVYRRSLEAATRRTWAPLAPFVSPEARRAIEASLADVDRIDEVVVGGLAVRSVRQQGGFTLLDASFLATRVEHAKSRSERILLEETWTFRRAANATSLAPEPTRRMGCPSCGAAIETDDLGSCRHCDTPISSGELQWQVADVRIGARQPAPPPALRVGPGGQEQSAVVGTVEAPDLGSAQRAFRARHPDFDDEALRRRVVHVFTELQAAWSANQWDRARPYTTDPMYQRLRFWVDRYRASGLRNRVEDVATGQIRIARIDVDAWYESLTLRIWASARDWVEDGQGRVVGGNKDRPRSFSEYWTFIRASGSGARSADPSNCPSCGAPLDRVDAAGTCGYCDSVITTGQFDWVLSRIDQPEVYAG